MAGIAHVIIAGIQKGYNYIYMNSPLSNSVSTANSLVIDASGGKL